MIGWLLQRSSFRGEYLGTLGAPIHAGNLQANVARAKDLALRHGRAAFLIAVDAAVAPLEPLGTIAVRRGPLEVGAGVRRRGQWVGNVHVTAATATSDAQLDQVDLNLTVSIAEVLALAVRMAQEQWQMQTSARTAATLIR